MIYNFFNTVKKLLPRSVFGTKQRVKKSKNTKKKKKKEKSGAYMVLPGHTFIQPPPNYAYM